MTPSKTVTALALLAVMVASCNGNDRRELDATATTSAAEAVEASAPTTTVFVNYEPPGPITEAGTGFLVGTSLDGSALYVASTREGFEKGCEEQFDPALFRQPLQGEPVALKAQGKLLRGSIVSGGSGNRVAIIRGCDAVVGLQMATQTLDGHLRNLKPLEVDTSEGQPVGIRWSAGGTSLLAGQNAAPGPSTNIFGKAVRIDPDSGQITKLFDVTRPVYSLGELHDGKFVVSGEGRVTVRDLAGSEETTVEGSGFALSQNSQRVAVFGRTLSLLSDTSATPRTVATPDTPTGVISEAQFSPNGRAIAYVSTGPTGGKVSILTFESGQVTTVTLEPGRYTRLLFTGDGRAIAFNRLPDKSGDEPTVLISRFAE